MVGVYATFVQEGKKIKVINICDVLDAFREENYSGTPCWEIPYEEENKYLDEWVKKNDAHFYARPREDFFLAEAVEEAFKAGKGIVVVEDMS